MPGEYPMSSKSGRWLLAVVALCCLAPAAFAHHDRGCDSYSLKNCRQVPEGGSTAIYLLGAGLTCFGAMLVRSRVAKRTQS